MNLFKNTSLYYLLSLICVSLRAFAIISNNLIILLSILFLMAAIGIEYNSKKTFNAIFSFFIFALKFFLFLSFLLLILSLPYFIKTKL